MKTETEIKKFLIEHKIDVIAVKNKEDVIKASELFEKIGINIFTTLESKLKFMETGDNVNNNFLIKDNDDGWRIQSHFITDGTSIPELESIINNINEENPNLLKNKSINDIKDEMKKIQDSFISINERLEKLYKLI